MQIKSNTKKVEEITEKIPHLESTCNYLKAVPMNSGLTFLAFGLAVSLLIHICFKDNVLTIIFVYVSLAEGAAGIGIGIYLKSLFSNILACRVNRIKESFEKCFISFESNEIRGVMLSDSKENDISQMNSIKHFFMSPLKPYLSIPVTCKGFKLRSDQISSIEISSKDYGLLQFQNCLTLTANGLNYYLMCLDADDAQKISEAFYALN